MKELSLVSVEKVYVEKTEGEKITIYESSNENSRTIYCVICCRSGQLVLHDHRKYELKSMVLQNVKISSQIYWMQCYNLWPSIKYVQANST